MPAPARWALVAAALLLLTATGLGAYASHGLAARIGTAELRSVDIAIQYQFFTSLGLAVVGVLSDRYPRSVALKLAAIALGGGAVLFCGSIYATTFGAPAAFGRAAPVGGVAIMAGWALLGLAVWRLGRRD